MAHTSTPWAQIRTIVRFTGARLTLSALGRLSPAVAAAVAETLFFAPGRPRRSRGEAVLESGERLHLHVEGRRVAAWRFGRGPAVALVHGWGGRAAQLSAFVAPLVDLGFSVVTFDAPGHGRSKRGLSSAPQFARALRAVVDAVGGAEAVLAHSLGAAATALAMRDGLAVDRVVFLAPPADPPSWAGPFASRLGVAPHVVERMRRRSEKRIGLRWDELKVPALATRFAVPLLVIHDRDDVEVPSSDGAAIAAAWKGARLVETTGLGHNRLLRDPRVVAQAVAFLAAAGGAKPRCATCGARVGPASGSCEQCLLDRELFDRDLRSSAASSPASAA